MQTVAVEDSQGRRRHVLMSDFLDNNVEWLHLCHKGNYCRGMPLIHRNNIRGAWCDKKNHRNTFRPPRRGGK